LIHIYAGGTVLGGAHRIVLEGDAETVWRTVAAIGGNTGWYFARHLWRLRGMLRAIARKTGLPVRRGPEKDTMETAFVCHL